ncbi:hypothetical protein BHE90_001221 [Fusarium euwallaceae]|uniref:Fungal N-terminal domain-containing protein n=1 Tax=Fusarium euwallaceae TaxID=1147111 RepID=A0A430M8A4_9HYPO|nr:hypothetical protein BHE90_001221 [Fusarium euwallaceae]
MDPLSVQASVAGIATAGAALANTLFRLVRTVRHAPREIQSVAIEMSSLASTLEHLHDVLATGASCAKPSFLQGVEAVVANITSTQDEISTMISNETIFERLRWMKAAGILSDIEKHRVTVTLQTSILSAAILVKSTTTHASAHERPENRFRIQAESLIQAGQVSLEHDNRYTRIPRQRAPSPPFRTTKRLPSPVRRSEIPGHVWPEDLFDRSGAPTTGARNPSSPEERRRSSRKSVSDTEREETDYADARDSKPTPDHSTRVPKKATVSDAEEEGEETPDQGNEADLENDASDEPRRRGSNGKVVQLGHNFRVRGDAATFLYNLVFQNQSPSPGDAKTENSSSEEEGWTGLTSEDSEQESRYSTRHASRPPRERPTPQEPEKAVDNLLLKWTLLSEREIEKGASESKSPEKEHTRERPSYENKEDDDWGEFLRKPRKSQSTPFFRNTGGIPSSPEGAKSVRRIIRPTRSETPQAGISPGNPFSKPPMDRPANRYSMPFTHPSFNTSGPSVHPLGGFGPREVPPPPWAQPPAFLFPRQPGQPPYESSWRESREPKKEESKPIKGPLQKPNIVILPYAEETDFETGASTPDLDIACLGLTVVRQREEAVWNSDEFIKKHGMPGKAIMASLVGDRSAWNAHGLDLAHTLMRGQNTKLIYVRGNELGETWFMNEQPVFLQFYHCGYLPQFYPARQSDEKAQKEEYVAIGEEWASLEALSQLGLSAKGQQEGRVLLDPTTTWSMLKELAITTLQLRCMKQRRQFTSTFYNSISLFRKTHGEVEAEPETLDTLPEEEPQDTTVTPPQEPVVEPSTPSTLTTQSFRIFDYEVKDEEEPSVPIRTRSMAETHHEPPQMSSARPTPPPVVPQPPPELDQDDNRSDMSSETLLSRFVRRYKPKKKQSRHPLRNRHDVSQTIAEHGSNDKRAPPTPSDSGIGSSVASARPL